ncbi:MAG: hypothetical protein WDO24_19610 [Pseudomonadota bacterium]
MIGDDPASREVIQLVGAEARLEPHLLVEPRRRTTIKTRFVAAGQQLLRADSETLAPISGPLRDQLLRPRRGGAGRQRGDDPVGLRQGRARREHRRGR